MSPDPIEIARLAERCKARNLLLTHLRPSMDHDEIHQKIEIQLQNNFSGVSGIAEDLMVIDL